MGKQPSWARRKLCNSSAFSEQLSITNQWQLFCVVFVLFAVLLFLSFFKVWLQQYLFPCWDAKQSQAICSTQASEGELSEEMLLVENTLRGLRVKVAQLELVCFNFRFWASNHFNIVFWLFPLMVCQLFPSQAERLNAADSLDLSDNGVPDPWTLSLRFLLENCIFAFWWLKIAAHPWLQKLPYLDWWLKIAACPWLQKLPFLDWRLCIATTLVQLEYCYPPKSTKKVDFSGGDSINKYIYIYVCSI